MTDSHTISTETLQGQPEHQRGTESTVRSLGLAAELGDQDTKVKNDGIQTKFDALLVGFGADSAVRDAVLQEHVDRTWGPKGMGRYEAMQYLIDIFETPAT